MGKRKRSPRHAHRERFSSEPRKEEEEEDGDTAGSPSESKKNVFCCF